MSDAESRTSSPVGQVEVGVLVLVPEPLAGQVSDVRRRVSGGQVPDIPTHVTLVPPTVVPADVLDHIEAHLGSVAGAVAPFEMRLRGTGTFQPVTEVAYLQVVTGREECDRLQEAIRTGPLAGDLRFPYHPHVTLAHDVGQAGLDRARAEMAGVDVAFRASEFVLYVARRADDWERVAAFPLGR